MVSFAHFLACTDPNLCVRANDVGVPSSTNNITDALANFTNLGLFVLGFLAVIFVVIGGLQYIFSGGNAARTKQARETILYAAIGLVIAGSAYGIVVFITGKLF